MPYQRRGNKAHKKSGKKSGENTAKKYLSSIRALKKEIEPQSEIGKAMQ